MAARPRSRPGLRRPTHLWVALAVVAGLLGSGVTGAPGVLAAFSPDTATAASSLATAADWVAPTVGSATIAKAEGGLTGAVRRSGGYHVYANVTDGGGTPSGVATVTANVTALTGGQAAAALSTTGCPCTIGGTSYSHRSSALTTDAGMAAGSLAYSLTSADGASNSRTQTGYAVTGDITVPAGSDVQAVNATGGTAGRVEAGDRATFTFTETIDPVSVLAGWSGASATVTARVVNAGGNDQFEVWNAADTARLPLGTVSLGANYVNATQSYTSSTMAQSGATITITVGTGATTATAGAATMSWTPSSTAFDAAGNPCSTTAVTESGAADADF